MSIHNEAKQGDIAPGILLAGDPLRAKYIAENFLEKAVCYNQVRGMLGYTGYYKGKRVSVQGSGMGVPSIAIYAHELMQEYNVRQLIRIGTCGSLQPDVKLRDVILAMSASTDSSFNKQTFQSGDFAPVAHFELLQKAYAFAIKRKMPIHVGSILTSDVFYMEGDDPYKKWREHGVLAVEMETTALYTLAARFGRQALTLLTVSDNLVTGEKATPQERQKSFTNMIEIALDSID